MHFFIRFVAFYNTTPPHNGTHDVTSGLSVTGLRYCGIFNDHAQQVSDRERALAEMIRINETQLADHLACHGRTRTKSLL